MDASKPLIGVLDEPGTYRDALAETIARDGLAVYAAERLEDLPAETVLVVAHAQAIPSLAWSSLTERLPTVVVSDSRLDADLLTAVDVGLVDYIVEPMRHGQLLRRMIRKALELRQLEDERNRDRERLAQLNAHLEELNESLETHLALLRLDQQAGGQIQRKLLPPHPQTINGVTCDYWLIPSLYLSGDFLDFQRFDERYTLFYFADVSGHGVCLRYRPAQVPVQSLAWRLGNLPAGGTAGTLADGAQPGVDGYGDRQACHTVRRCH